MKNAVTVEFCSAPHSVLWMLIGLLLLLFTASHASDKNRLINDTLAMIGDKVITSARFEERYKEKLVTLGLTDNGATRLGYLSNIVDDEILIKQARQEKLDRTNEAINRYTSIGIQELLNAYSEKHFAKKSEVTENDLRTLFIKMNKKIKVSHLYAQTKRAADSLYLELSHGRNFDELAERAFTDPKLKAQHGSLGYISLDETDPEFEKTAYAMHIGEISKPVKTVQGYSIIRVDDIKGNPFVTESEFAKAKHKLRGFAKRRKYEETVRRFTSDLRSNLHIQFNAGSIHKLFELSKTKTLWHSVEEKSSVLSERDLHEAAVTWTNGKWNVGELIKALSNTTDRQRAWIRTDENLEDVAAGLILQHEVIQEAKQEKLDAAPSYRANVAEAFETYLLSTLENRMKSHIKISADSLQSYYLRHKNDFKTPEEIRLSAILVDNASKSDSIQHLLEQGAPFSELARRYSLQTFTAGQGGDLGFYTRKELGDLGAKIFPLKQGEWLGPLIDAERFLFIQCTGRKEALQRSFEESKNEIENFLGSMMWVDVRHQYAESLKNTFGCRMYPEKLRTMTLH